MHEMSLGLELLGQREGKTLRLMLWIFVYDFEFLFSCVCNSKPF